MKTIIALLLLSVAAVSAQLTITNTVKIAISTNDDAALRLAWKLDNNARTNGLAPYASITNSLTFGQWQDLEATEAFRALAAKKADENFTQVAVLYRTATDADRARVARILAGLSN